jgi:hypothetical protein
MSFLRLGFKMTTASMQDVRMIRPCEAERGTKNNA